MTATTISIELNTNELIDQKLEYIQLNPVAAGFVHQPGAWLFAEDALQTCRSSR